MVLQILAEQELEKSTMQLIINACAQDGKAATECLENLRSQRDDLFPRANQEHQVSPHTLEQLKALMNE
ncbi:MAG: hypothetical protein SFY81_04980 [Verrucomicrobiota bacterium]|nr:hypothetical protein [Verrucomicrobiota bacterium]